MRYEVYLDVTPDGRVIQLGWAARDHELELVALGTDIRPAATNGDLTAALVEALELCQRNVEANGGVQAPLPF